MGLLDLFRMGKVLVHTAKAVKHQRDVAQEVRALPMPELIARCLQGMHSPHTDWRATARPPRSDAALAAAAKRLPAELAEFYSHCDGFQASDDFPVRMLPLGQLRLGADHSPCPSQLIEAGWREHGNESEREGYLTILPPDNLTALMTNSAEGYLRPTALDVMLPVVPLEPNEFTVVLLTSMGERLPAGTVLEYENGVATRFDGLRHWLATRGTLFETLACAA
jgi:hypothetical protein